MKNEKEKLMNQVNESYGKIDFTSLHFHISEMLSGHERESTEKFFNNVNYSLPFDFDNCRMIVTGLPQNIYKPLFHWQQSEAAQFFAFEYKKTMDHLLTQYGYSGLSIIFLFDGRKHYVTLFSPCTKKPKDPWKIAFQINEFLQEKYEQMNHSSIIQACNCTALSEPITDYSQISEQFSCCKDLVKLSWFIEKSQVIDINWVKNIRLKENKIFLINRFHSLLNQLFETELIKIDEELNLIFDQAGKMLDFALIQDILTSCRDTMNSLIVTYQINYKTDIEKTCQISTYLYYSQCSRCVRHLIIDLVKQILDSRKIYSSLTKKIIHTLHSNYSKQISIQDIADQVHASANYCSSLFKKETGSTINEALTQLRLEEAKRLLMQDELKIKEIASQCGFGSTRYFSEIFNMHFNLSPTSWKKKYISSIKATTE